MDKDNQLHFEAANHGDVMLAGLRHLRDKCQLFDMILTVGEEDLPVHRVVLASCSEYFRAMFTDGLKESKQECIILNGVTATGMRNLIDFAYTSKINIDTENVYDVLGAANHVQILPVLTACEDFLKQHLDLNNCIDVMNVAELYSLQPLYQVAQQYISKNWSTFALSNDFLKLSVQELSILLSSHFPVDCSEYLILSSVLDWLEYNFIERIEFVPELLGEVMFECISGSEMEVICANSIWTNLLTHVPEVQDFLKRVGQNPVSKDWLASSGICNLRGFQHSLIVAGGFTNEGGLTNSVWYLDTTTGQLRHLTKIPHVDQCNFGMGVLNNKLYAVGGCFNDQMQELIHPFCFCYDAQSDAWESIAPMSQERCNFYLGVLEGRFFAIGGDPQASLGVADTAPCESFDPDTNTWVDIEPMPGNRMQHSGTSHGRRLYVSGGLQEQDGDVFDDLLWFDLNTNSWYRGASMRTPRADHSMFVFNEKIYISGGWFYDTHTQQRVIASTIDCYDIETDCWETVATLNECRLFATYTMYNGCIYVVGGWRGGNYRRKCNTIDVFDLTRGEWIDKKHQRLQVWEHSSCTMYLPRFII
ncbi:kelch-like protein 26 [Patella vulgata]|uniref:kelch-like protein 26 n=1 Tax=Patella vulgata TaxID=6465 RepID=UPI00217FC6BC|nr:kelch-like protein 26 [Patella vulgata]